MKQKAQIDVLELPSMEGEEEPAEITDFTVDSEPPQVEAEEAPAEITDFTVDSEPPQVEAEEAPSPLPEVKKSTASKKLYWIASGAIIAIITAGIAGYFIWFHQGEKKTTAPVVATVVTWQKNSMAAMDDFNIDVKDGKGNIRLLTCGFLLEMAPQEDGKSLETNIEIRRLIFESVHKRTVSDLIRNDEKKAIKKEITAGVNRLLGAEKVKETYITKFLLL